MIILILFGAALQVELRAFPCEPSLCAGVPALPPLQLLCNRRSLALLALPFFLRGVLEVTRLAFNGLHHGLGRPRPALLGLLLLRVRICRSGSLGQLSDGLNLLDDAVRLRPRALARLGIHEIRPLRLGVHLLDPVFSVSVVIGGGRAALQVVLRARAREALLSPLLVLVFVVFVKRVRFVCKRVAGAAFSPRTAARSS